jgi:hypothetical protein
MAGEAAGTLSAAATTLEFAHQGKVTTNFAESSFGEYKEQLKDVPDELAKADGAPDSGKLRQLSGLLERAQPAIDRPCLADDGCDWQAQDRALKEARQALEDASEG